MDNNEKAEEIVKDYNYTQFLNDGTHDSYTETAVLYMLNEMAQWKEQQMIERAVEWLKNNIYDYYRTDEFEQWFDEMFDDFKQSMKEK